MTSNLFLWPICLLIGLGILAAIHRAITSSPAARYGNLILERSLQGVSGAEVDLEITLRTAAARFRREVSIAVIQDPGRCEEILRTMAKDETMLLAATDKGAAKNFIDWVEGAGLSEILYPAAMKAVWKAVGHGPAPIADIDLEAALRVRP